MLWSHLRVLAGFLIAGAMMPTGASATGEPRASAEKWALVIGVQRYSEAKGFAPLRFTERDAQAFRDLLVDPQRGGYDESRVKLLTTAAQDPEQLPTRGNILGALRSLVSRAQSDREHPPDTVLVYFSGHGVHKERESYLIPVDAGRDDLAETAVSLEAVRERLNDCGAKKQIVVVDACRSEPVGKGEGERQSVEFAQALERFARAEGRVVLASCGKDQLSYEDEDRKHSAFTGFLLEGLKGAADADDDGVISIREAHAYASRELGAWAEKRGTVQYPEVYGEEMLPLPLAGYPRNAEVRVDSTPEGARIWIDGEDTGRETPSTVEVEVAGGKQRELGLKVIREGYQDGTAGVTVVPGDQRDVSLRLRELAKLPPDLKPTEQGLVATTLCRGVDDVRGLAHRPDGSLLVAVGSHGEALPGVYVAKEGRDCDPAADAYTKPGPPFREPNGLLVHPDGRVLVADSGASTVWSIPAPGASPEVLTDRIPGPQDILIAPQSFAGPQVNPGDLLICASSPKEPEASGLYVISQQTGKVGRLAGPPGLANGLVQAEFGPDGKLYAMEDDARTHDGVTIVTISADGQVAPVLGNYMPLPVLQAVTGPLAVDPVTGRVLFADGSSVYQLPSAGLGPTRYASGGLKITALEFSPDGSSLLASDAGQQLLVRIAPCLIEGKLLVGSWAMTHTGESEESCDIIEGRLDKRVPIPAVRRDVPDTWKGQFDLSPLMDQVVYCVESVVEGAYDRAEPWHKRSTIWKAGLDGHNAVNLSERAGLGGISCLPLWSPDGRRIAFRHCDPVVGSYPCETGLDIWVMNADGAEAHRVASANAGERGPSPSERSPYYWWLPTGDRLIYRYGDRGQVVSVDTDGTQPQPLGVFSGNLSPDGSKIADDWTKSGVLHGEPGVWRQVLLTDADGGGEEVLVQRFVKDADVAKQLALQGKDPKDPRGVDDVRTWVGPRLVRWSPKGDRVAFLAAMFFQPQQAPDFKAQLDVWIYDLTTRILTRITDDTPMVENKLSWRGPNTYVGRPEVTVGNTTVTFSEVTAEGLTIVARDDHPPRRPKGYRFCGRYYEITTTAKYTGPVTIRMTYQDADVPGGDEQSLSLLRFDEQTAQWQDITSSRDPAANVVCGKVGAL